ncbi:Gfo/Idh/MocA family oxidoreductase [Aliikangiella coralliicola]|uniref:Gfo/Idh/MocA family oxidoreductase n=2 Tax=Aliikangiella coralliicola TaxID=2592383 RepID=A0A545U543_9GAMM|nr:Gfo/Idh/MocA family oxidoreductase [Aliikangiella coralliicola]
MGMVGGGEGAFIGAIHRIAARMDGEIELVCGAFSRDAERSKAFGESLYFEQNRCYPNYHAMFEMEGQKPSQERMDMVAIVTPNHLHFPVAKMALEHGFHVLCDKPATLDLAEAITLRQLVDKTGLLYGLTHTYTGYPLIKEARHRVIAGQLGQIRKVVVEYPQGWLADKHSEQSKQASWRLDPAQAGLSGCMADIGVHGANLAEYVTGLKISEVCADLSTAFDDRMLDDDGTVLMRFNSGARGVLMASQVCVGEENNLKLRVYGEFASIEWSQMAPNDLWMKYADRPTELIRTGVGSMAANTLANIRTPAGHPEGYLEAFANIYRNFAHLIQARIASKPASQASLDVPGIDEAIRGMAFIENVVAASRSELKWHPFRVELDSE